MREESVVKDEPQDEFDAVRETDPARHSGIDIGRPVEWMIDRDRSDIILGVTYEFNLSGERRTAWYTPNKRKPKGFVLVRKLEGL